MNRCIAHPLCTNSAAASEDVPTYARERFGNQKAIWSGIALVRSSYGLKANAEAEARPTRYRTRSLVPLTSTQCERRRICPVSSRRISRRISLPSTVHLKALAQHRRRVREARLEDCPSRATLRSTASAVAGSCARCRSSPIPQETFLKRAEVEISVVYGMLPPPVIKQMCAHHSSLQCLDRRALLCNKALPPRPPVQPARAHRPSKLLLVYRVVDQGRT
ncbi:hypothetical protein BD311DRAFT_524805 [Dichomitus squalens]|uniref:Uncharacterized protein n=1 Tax=Dichomitus squalens TaxID=114155 RepID=A0A4Q9MCQ4_9APHY|nr:hypothetical protein BD311DRAFT_524805 [Dichomitus squalens]